MGDGTDFRFQLPGADSYRLRYAQGRTGRIYGLAIVGGVFINPNNKRVAIYETAQIRIRTCHAAYLRRVGNLTLCQETLLRRKKLGKNNFYNLIWDPIMQTFSDGNLKYLVAFTELRPIKLNNVSRNGLIPVRLAITIESLPKK